MKTVAQCCEEQGLRPLLRSLRLLLIGPTDYLEFRVEVRTRGGARPTVVETTLGGVGDDPQGRPARPSVCRNDVFRVLKEAGHRLTLEGIEDALMRAGLDWSGRTVQRQLKDLLAEGKVDNRQDGTGKGYGLLQ